LKHLLSFQDKLNQILKIDEFETVLGDYHQQLTEQMKSDLNLANINLPFVCPLLKQYVLSQLTTINQHENHARQPLRDWIFNLTMDEEEEKQWEVFPPTILNCHALAVLKFLLGKQK